MEREFRKSRRLAPLLICLAIVLIGFMCWLTFFTPLVDPLWRAVTREGKRLLGWEQGEIPPEEKRIREEVILKKMEEANANQDWRTFAPEYPRPQTPDPAATEEERIQALKNSPEFKKLEHELIDYLRKEEEFLRPEPPIPAMGEEMDLPRLKDKRTERVMEGLFSKKEKLSQEKPLEENLELGIRGPLATRKILEKPPLPQVKVRVEAEIELTFWVLPNGIVDRAIPSVKGDTELERISIQYLKQWRFAPLSKDEPQAEEWGIIPVKFKLQ